MKKLLLAAGLVSWRNFGIDGAGLMGYYGGAETALGYTNYAPGYSLWRQLVPDNDRI